jgi:hypothetical protein
MDQTPAGIAATKLLDYQGFRRQVALLLNKTEHQRSNPDNHRGVRRNSQLSCRLSFRTMRTSQAPSTVLLLTGTVVFLIAAVPAGAQAPPSAPAPVALMPLQFDHARRRSIDRDSRCRRSFHLHLQIWPDP